jgi:hypothetical protein
MLASYVTLQAALRCRVQATCSWGRNVSVTLLRLLCAMETACVGYPPAHNGIMGIRLIHASRHMVTSKYVWCVGVYLYIYNVCFVYVWVYVCGMCVCVLIFGMWGELVGLLLHPESHDHIPSFHHYHHFHTIIYGIPSRLMPNLLLCLSVCLSAV